MSIATRDTVEAPIKLLKTPDLSCDITSIKQLIASLPDYLIASIPTDITNVVVGNIQPSDTQRNTIWFQKDNGGNFIGIKIYSSGKWVPFFPIPGQVFPVYRNSADSTTPPAGYTRLDSAPGVPSSVYTPRMATWIADPLNPGFYLYYEVVFTGF